MTTGAPRPYWSPYCGANGLHLLTELAALPPPGAASSSPVVALLFKAAELHVRADLGVVDAAEPDLTP